MISKICCQGSYPFGRGVVCLDWSRLLSLALVSMLGTSYVVADEPVVTRSPVAAPRLQAEVVANPIQAEPWNANAVGYSIDLVPPAAVPFPPPRDPMGYARGPMVPLELSAVLRHHCYGACGSAADETVCAACASGQPAKCHHRGRVGGRMWEKHKPAMQASHLGYPEYFVERPFGASIDAALSAQVRNGMQDQSVLYDYDFLPAPRHDQLSPAGKQHLRRIVLVAERWQLPIIVNHSPEDTGLAGLRREQVIQVLADWDALIDPGMVLVGISNTTGLRGLDAQLIRDRETQLIQSGGASAGSGTSGASAATPGR